MTLLARLLEWPRRREPAGDDGPRIVRKGDRGERQPDPDPIEELVRIVGESIAGDRRPRGNQTA